jgi:thioredoxin-like negative regulator of GroEL
VNSQLLALAVVGVVVLAAVALESFRAWRARRVAILAVAAPAPEPYIIYFTGESCTVCKTHQEPALARLGGVRVDRVDAVAERELSERFQVYTLPTTIVMAPDGRPVHVNYGYAPAPKLERQLAEVRGSFGAAATA